MSIPTSMISFLLMQVAPRPEPTRPYVPTPYTLGVGCRKDLTRPVPTSWPSARRPHPETPNPEHETLDPEP
jgi:hypothetical protein